MNISAFKDLFTPAVKYPAMKKGSKTSQLYFKHIIQTIAIRCKSTWDIGVAISTILFCYVCIEYFLTAVNICCSDRVTPFLINDNIPACGAINSILYPIQ